MSVSAPDHDRAVRYDRLADSLRALFPDERLIRDPLRTLAYGTDASFYRLIPQIVVMVETEAEVIALLAACHAHRAPVTFRAAGTSLSGQAVTDSVLAVLSGWTGAVVAPDGSSIRLQPGVVGADANRRLAAFGRKIGPDPASINAAKIGGIAANNSSGMCCGTAQNSYQTLASVRVVLADGAVLDTADAASRAAFLKSHAVLLEGLGRLAARTKADLTLAERIARKFRIKNTTGYSLNALIDFDDPIEILQHLMIGSEGTLGFIAAITYRTVPDHPCKATALLCFADIGQACEAVAALKGTPVAAVELMDRAALRSVEDKLPKDLAALPATAAALLVEIRAEDAAGLDQRIAQVASVVRGHALLAPAAFTSDRNEAARLWDIRKGLFPSVGAVRATGTTVIIEDIAVPVTELAAATLDLQGLFAKHGYAEAIIFGHALDGNLHFVFTQDFGTAPEVERYSRFMDDVCRLVVEKYDGSLKAEHGTGRNMGPFVELEWGRDAYRLMREIKALFDPSGLLNPGVIITDDAQAHLKDLKPLPPADRVVDTCIECGFCEPMCPSRGLTLTPRQRITAWREVSKLTESGEDAPRRAAMRHSYDYFGIDTCAACGLCSTACPVGINTGTFIKGLRARRLSPAGERRGEWVARHYRSALNASRHALRVGGWARSLLGDDATDRLGRVVRRAIGRRMPLLTHSLPQPITFAPSPAPALSGRERVVYVPSCASRSMGPAANDPEQRPLPEVVAALLDKAGYEVVYPAGLDNLCCGQAFDSKGLAASAAHKAREMAEAMHVASDGGRIPIVMDTSPCALRMKEHVARSLPVHDIVEFIHDHVLARVRVQPIPASVAIHATCSARRMGLDGTLTAVAAACAERVVVPEGITCCGFAGDKGFTTPELNAHALKPLAGQLDGCESGYSSSRTCEIGLGHHGGIPYRSIAYLVERCASPCHKAQS